MSLLLLAAAAGALLYLWKRVDALETRVSLLESWGLVPSHSEEAAPVREEAPALADPQAQPLRASFEYRAAYAQRPGEPETPGSLWDAPAADGDEEATRVARWTPKLSFDFEEIFGRLLPIWAGGVALAVAGFFLVRFSIEAGLLSPGVRVGLGFAFGAALLASAEAAFRFEGRISDVRVRQSLAGAGLATLYASFYLAGAHYGLVGTTMSFLGLAGVTAAAILLSFRFGLPSAVLGLVGGFAAPTLAGGDEANLPLLALYLALITAGLSIAGQRQRRSWLGLAALAGGLGWGALLLLGEVVGPADTVALGGYILVLGAALPWLLNRDRAGELGRLVAPALATVQMAALVDQGEYGPLAWFLYVLLAAAVGFFAWAQPRMRAASLLAAVTGLWMLAFWPEPRQQDYAAVAVALTVIFGGLPLLRAWRRAANGVDFTQICAFSLGLLAITYWHFGNPVADTEPGLALVALGLASIPAFAVWRNWTTTTGEQLSAGTFAALTSSAVALFAAGLIATPAWSAPLVAATVSLVVLQLARGRLGRVTDLAWAAGVVALLALAFTPAYATEVLHLAGSGSGAGGALLEIADGKLVPVDALVIPLWQSVARWLATALPFLLLAAADRRAGARYVAQALAASLLYGLTAQLLPWQWLPAASAAAGIAVATRLRGWVPASATFVSIALLWAVEPVLEWVAAGAGALAGLPMLLPSMPTLDSTLLRALPAAVAAAVALFLWWRSLPNRPAWAWAGVAALGGVVAHVLYKQLFGIVSIESFVALGLAERVVWEGALVGSALLLSSAGRQLPASRPGALVLILAALAHFGWFSLLMHNPLWTQQSVGPWPLINWLLPAYLIGVGSLWILRQRLADGYPAARPGIDAAIMVLVAVYGVSALRQFYAGPLLQAVPVAQTEDLLRSLLGIVLALVFLMWGTWRGGRSWRIGSLVLMLLAVLKVFLFDAASLEGLARIGSFMALGFSLIGIGWFYSRQLAVPKVAEAGSGRLMD